MSGIENDDDLSVIRGVHTNLESEDPHVDVDLDVHWKKGTPPEVIKAQIDKLVATVKDEISYLA